ncbi:HNH endonuclease signature motif containing protein [Microbacterium sp. CIAB417]|uniref:HNH endonuclease signature motif containing protein n=1 Tax=Microbacterium sp. CIAB417 TaxID=2860287 RepID=UPI001FAD9B70|nr:HNH endonuclease signature motif containing protein [Microbacterium sp. CIAB417]
MAAKRRGPSEDSLAYRRALLDEWVDAEREVSRLHARQAVLLAERLESAMTDPDADLDAGEVSLRSLAAEYAAAAHIPPSTASIRLTDAWVLVRRFPAVLAAMAEGVISRRHADAIVNEAPQLAQDAEGERLRAAYEAEVLAFARHDTAAGTRACARAVAAHLCPQSTAEAHRRARKERSVTVRPDGDGMAVLTAILPEILAFAIKDRLTGQARSVRAARRRVNGVRPVPEYEPMLPEEPLDLDAELRRILDDVPGWERSERDEAEGAEGDSSSDADGDGAVVADEGGSGATAARDIEDPSAASVTTVVISERDFPIWSPVHDDVVNEPAGGPPGLDGDLSTGSEHSFDGQSHPRDDQTHPPGDPWMSDTVRPPWLDEVFDELVASFEEELFTSAPPIDPAPKGADPGGCRAGTLLDDDLVGVLETDTRTMDQLRADILADLLLASDPSTLTQTGIGSVQATVQVSIAAETLIGVDDRFAEHDAHGPVLPDTVRLLAGHSPSWTRLFVDPQGLVTETDGYTPTAAMKRFLRARDQHCRFPGCRAPAAHCQIDHNHDHAKGGRTQVSNLSLFCTGHHPIKHPDLADEDRWTVRQLAEGLLEWNSPLGRTYTDHPTRRVLFT